jgi:hypothetical protein
MSSMAARPGWPVYIADPSWVGRATRQVFGVTPHYLLKSLRQPLAELSEQSNNSELSDQGFDVIVTPD